MGTDNIIYLADRTDLAVPSYRRARLGTPGASTAAAQGSWHVLARQRGASTQATQPAASGAPPLQAAPGTTDASRQSGAHHHHAATANASDHSPSLSLLSPAHGHVAARRVAPAPVRMAATTTVRVAHPIDAAPTGGLGDGRLRISGRLIDVCAELERLAAAEDQAALARRA